MSVALPAVNGTTIFTGLVGQDCAIASDAHANPKHSDTNRPSFIVLSCTRTPLRGATREILQDEAFVRIIERHPKARQDCATDLPADLLARPPPGRFCAWHPRAPEAEPLVGTDDAGQRLAEATRAGARLAQCAG